MDLLVSLLILLLVIGIAYWALTSIPLPQPVRTVAVVVLAIIAIVMLLSFMPGLHWPAR